MSEFHDGIQQPPFPPQHTAPKPPKKRHVLRNIGIVVGGLFALLIVAAVLSPGQPAKEAVTNSPAAVESPAAVKSTKPVPTTAAPKTTPAKPTPPPKPSLTKSQEQAIGSAESYLSFTAFSRKGLIRQLSSDAGEGFSVADATYAVDHVKVDWNEQAAKAARGYLEMTHFSRQGLIHQLESPAGDGFTHRQAVYGVTKAGL